jgi:GNAT superfamily N-acetyltransferase
MSPIEFREIESLDDPIYDAWLDLYQQAFPIDEQMLVSWHNEALRGKPAGEKRDQHLLAAVDLDGHLVGMARYDYDSAAGATALWYLATEEQIRGQGMGAQVLAEIVRRARASHPDQPGLFFEVGAPATGAEPPGIAQRRIDWYRRNGAKILTGIDYVQSVGWQPPRRMQIMALPFAELSAEECFNVASRLFGETVQRAGPLSLT